ncbi:N-acetylmuramoyl-L-alanine amidase [Algicella marina]|uniref:N-acetylmuramoyl-L-alanine amidase n=2 Tax=Algicella marina TaxID=2683284 RepID=A0A6P1T6Y6_9RHOB|nr:N-acetylmuramoyl-L-alanine amidase [Algicella marina]QHQ37256.1 N-acetylmuramoyl-L-alanine amidase [Algicella marina]
MVVLHYTAMASAEAALARLASPDHEVSAHYLIDPQGRIWAMVAEEMRAWHAGVAAWGGVDDVNSHSIGIEIQNDGSTSFQAAQMSSVEWLLRDISERWRITPERVLGHSDVAPARKSDPGRWFDWLRLARAGLAAWPDGVLSGCPVDRAEFMLCAERVGYRGEFRDVLTAVRLRFCPWAVGLPLRGADVAIVKAAAAQFPCIDGENFTS